MRFKRYEPPRHLKALVAYYWTLSSQGDRDKPSYRFVPDGYVDWIFHLSAPWQCYFPDQEIESSTPQFHVFGQIKQHVDLHLPPEGLNLFGVKFNPWAVRHIWNVDMHHLTDTCYPLDVLQLKGINDLKNRMLEASGTKSRIALIESYLGQFANLKADESLTKTYNAYLYTTYKSRNADKPHFGIRRLEQRFKAEIGITPKLFYRTERVNHVIAQLLKMKKGTLTQLAHHNEYYDQSHLIKEFNQFTGLSPKNFLKSIEPDGDILNLSISA